MQYLLKTLNVKSTKNPEAERIKSWEDVRTDADGFQKEEQQWVEIFHKERRGNASHSLKSGKHSRGQ